MAERNLTDADISALSKAIGKQAGPSSAAPTGPGAGNKAIDAALSETANKLNPFAQNLKDGGEAAKEGFKTAQKAVTDSLDTWRDLSKSGAGFNNDVVGMTIAAAGTRLPLKEFAGVIKDNTDVLGALGGSVTRGAESFAKMSKSFFDSGATDSLKLLGYTNKDLNEVLMLQAVTMRGKFKDDQQRDAVAIENASKLATEMDLMAKLTGKSREAQMEQMKKNQMDMQFEASIRLKTQGMSAEEAAKFEANARTQLKDAQLRGQGDMFKEVFATGQIVSKESAMQAAVNQEQANATMKQARATALGDEKAAAEANREAQRAAVADANNTTKLGMVALGGAAGVAGKALTDSMGAQMTYTRSLEATAAANNLDIKNTEDRAKAQKIMEEEAKKAQAGKNKEGEQVDGATKAAVQLGNRVDDVRAALTTGLLEPLNKEIGPGLRTFADKYLSGKDFEGSGKRMAPAIEGAMARGNKAAQADGAPDRRTETEEPGLVTGIAKGVGFAEGKVLQGVKKGVEGVNNLGKPIEKRATGGPVQEGEPYIVGDGGEEELFVPKTAGDIVPKSMLAPKGLNSRSENMESAYKSMSSMDPTKMLAELKAKTAGGGINFNEISKDISTTISGGGSSSIKLDAAAIADMTKPFEKSFADFNTGFEDLVVKSSKGFTLTPFEEGFDEFGSNFDDVVAKMATDLQEAMPIDSIDQTAAALEFASKRRQELEDIMNDGIARSGAEWDEIFDEAEQLDGQIEKLTNKQLDAMSKYSDGWSDTDDIMDQVYSDINEAMPVDTEFGDLDGAIAKNQADDAMKNLVADSSPTKDQGRGISMDSFTLGPNGLPIAKPKSTAAAVPEKKPEEKKASPGKAINPETGEEYTPVGDAKSSDKKTVASGGSDSKAATLDDVVKSLNALNSKMGQLISTTETGHKDVAKAAKSGSTNVYAR